MNRVLRGLFAFSLLTSFVVYGADSCCTNATGCNTCNSCCYDCNNCCLGPCDGYPFLQIRSQGRDSARELVGWQQFTNKYDMDSTYGAFSATVEYSRSFRNERLTHFLFGNDLVNCCELHVQGSQAPNRNPKAWMADSFGLPTDFESKISFCPKIQNIVIDLNFYLGLDELAEGLFMRLNAPIVWTKWELCPCERVCNQGENGFDAGYMSTSTIPRTSLAKSFLQTMNGSYKFGDMQTPIRFGRIGNNCCTKTRLGEIDFSFGWNFSTEEDHHFGAFLYVAAPAGNRPCGTYLFEPMVGNGKHWEFGGGFTGSWIFYRSEECEDRYMGLWLEATVAHLFKTCQCRSFDFCCKPNSRYMLLEEMGSNDDVIQGEVDGESVTANYQYKKNLIPAINWATFNIDVRIDVQADIALKFGYISDNWDFDIGYNLWARTGEKFCCDCCACDTGKKYAIKGDTWLYGAEGAAGDGDKSALSASQSLANIRSGKNYPAVDSDNPKTNPRIDNPYNAEKDGTDLYVIGDSPSARIKTSIDPVLVSRNLLNLGKSPSAITHKVFAHIGYAWKDCQEDWVPFLGIGGKVEFAQDNYKDCCCDSCNTCCDPCCNTTCSTTCNTNSCSNSSNSCCNNNCCDSCCDSCTRRGGVSVWGVWIKGGVAFD
ncbi:hypothetical protein ACFLYU_04725 [Candidatus Dependentiae bacterium]